MLRPSLKIGERELLDEDPVPQDPEPGALTTHSKVKRSGATKHRCQRLIVRAGEVLGERRVPRQPRGITHFASSS